MNGNAHKGPTLGTQLQEFFGLMIQPLAFGIMESEKLTELFLEVQWKLS
jgi:hypothetical protein